MIYLSTVTINSKNPTRNHHLRPPRVLRRHESHGWDVDVFVQVLNSLMMRQGVGSWWRGFPHCGQWLVGCWFGVPSRKYEMATFLKKPIGRPNLEDLLRDFCWLFAFDIIYIHGNKNYWRVYFDCSKGPADFWKTIPRLGEPKPTNKNLKAPFSTQTLHV